jgi:hypothetical protein
VTEDQLAVAAGFLMTGIARDDGGHEIHIFQKPAAPQGAGEPFYIDASFDVRLEPTSLDGDIRRLRAIVNETLGWNDAVRMLTFCGSITRVLDELEALRKA